MKSFSGTQPSPECGRPLRNHLLHSCVNTHRHVQLYKCHCSGLSVTRCVCVLSVVILLTFHVVNRNVVYLFTSASSTLIKLACVFVATADIEFASQSTKMSSS